jgi:anti-sigma factor RsiW
MSCESIRAELVAYLHDELSAPRRTEVQRHLEGCRECSAELDGFRQTQKAVGRLRVSAASTGFEKKVQERIAAKVEDLRARGSVRFRTGRERNAEAAKWPGLSAWLGQRRRALWLFLIAAVPVVAVFALIWLTVVKPYFDDVRARKEFARKQFEAMKRGQNFQLRLQASGQRRDLAVSADGWVSGADFLGGGSLRLVPVRDPSAEGRPEGRCVYVFTAAQWNSFLGQENICRGTPLHEAWKNMVQAATEVLPEKGRLFLPAHCFRQLLAEPDKVSVLAIGNDHCEIWDAAELDDYLLPRPMISPSKP